LLHVPCLVRFPGGEGALLRSQALVQPADLFATIADAAGWSTHEVITNQSLLRLVRGEETNQRMMAVAAAARQQVIRTAAWQLRVVMSDEGDRLELFVKPDDRFEINDVASRAPDIVHKLLEAAQPPQLEHLPEELISPWR
jgi:arylsulfatase A-like enzyme